MTRPRGRAVRYTDQWSCIPTTGRYSVAASPPVEVAMSAVRSSRRSVPACSPARSARFSRSSRPSSPCAPRRRCRSCCTSSASDPDVAVGAWGSPAVLGQRHHRLSPVLAKCRSDFGVADWVGSWPSAAFSCWPIPNVYNSAGKTSSSTTQFRWYAPSSSDWHWSGLYLTYVGWVAKPAEQGRPDAAGS